MEDQEIIELFFARSEQAITELQGKYGNRCMQVAWNILNNRLDAEECVNDAYLATWNTIPPQKPDPLLTYVCHIVRNLSIKRYHANAARKRNSHYDVALDELGNDGTVYTEMSVYEMQNKNSEGIGIQLRSFQYAIDKIKQDRNRALFYIHKPGPLPQDDEYLQELADIYARGLFEVDNFIQDNLAEEGSNNDL